METSNPIVDARARARAAEAYRYPYTVVCVFEDKEDFTLPIILEVKSYCDENNITFTSRRYNCDKYEEDREDVYRLPAFHIYHKKTYHETHHYDTDPVHKIQLVIWNYQDKEVRKQELRARRQEQWKKFTSLFSLKKKPILDPSRSL